MIDSIKASYIIKTMQVKTNGGFLLNVKVPGNYEFRIIIFGFKDAYVAVSIKPEDMGRVILKKIILRAGSQVQKIV